ncbi:DUF1127 domain-containing protein [Devosia beringensis]|uniref:DUF1127 domain-containing protein n=1 Tax=Devosia beringensis TaxID=2657486 RepID=UPI00186BA879
MLDAFWHFLVRRWQRANTIYQLRRLDDHLLVDIGTPRDAIIDVVKAIELELDHADQHPGNLRACEPADAGRGRHRHGLGAGLAC